MATTDPSYDGPGPNGAGFPDAPCVRYYRTIRADVPSTSRQLGYGVNKRVVPAPVAECLTRIYAGAVTRAVEYDDAAVRTARELIAVLLERHLGLTGLDTEQIVLFHGATEAISVASAYAAREGLQPLLPLPNYYAFEHSLSRYGAPRPVHYSATGRLSAPVPAERPRMLVDVVPNGVLGTCFTRPDEFTRPAPDDLAVVDVPFSLPALGDGLTEILRHRVAVPTRRIVCLTPSKDLSVPGLRVGVVASTDPGFVAFAAADRFERGYSLHMATAMIGAVHLGLLVLAESGGRASAELSALFARHGISFPDGDRAAEFVAAVAAMRRDFARNLDLLDECGLFEPVDGAQSPVAGYSTFRWLRAGYDAPSAFTGWVNATGRAGLKVNPNCLFGGDDEVWTSLYPRRYGIRLNISVDAAELRENLALLGRQVGERVSSAAGRS